MPADNALGIATTLQRLRRSLVDSAGTVVFGMEDGTVSIFGLIFGVAATTTNAKTVLVAGASGAVAAAVSMMAGAYVDVETTRDEINAKRPHLQDVLARDAGVAVICCWLIFSPRRYRFFRSCFFRSR